jgi:hypothetical protein
MAVCWACMADDPTLSLHALHHRCMPLDAPSTANRYARNTTRYPTRLAGLTTTPTTTTTTITQQGLDPHVGDTQLGASLNSAGRGGGPRLASALIMRSRRLEILRANPEPHSWLSLSLSRLRCCCAPLPPTPTPTPTPSPSRARPLFRLINTHMPAIASPTPAR